MTTYKLLRKLDDGTGTFGRLYDESGSELCRVVERPWKNNEKKVSCIPVGKYPLGLYPYGKKFYPKYRTKFANIGNNAGMIIINDVPGRTHVLWHRGNFPKDSWACLLLNTSVGRGDDGKLRGYASTEAYRRVYPIVLKSIQAGETFLEVENGF